MKLRSAQFVLLVLLFSSLSLSEVSSRRLAGEMIGMPAAGSAGATTRTTQEPRSAGARSHTALARTEVAWTIRTVWSMRAAAAQAASIEAVTGFAAVRGCSTAA